MLSLLFWVLKLIVISSYFWTLRLIVISHHFWALGMIVISPHFWALRLIVISPYFWTLRLIDCYLALFMRSRVDYYFALFLVLRLNMIYSYLTVKIMCDLRVSLVLMFINSTTNDIPHETACGVDLCLNRWRLSPGCVRSLVSLIQIQVKLFYCLSYLNMQTVVLPYFAARRKALIPSRRLFIKIYESSFCFSKLLFNCDSEIKNSE